MKKIVGVVLLIAIFAVLIGVTCAVFGWKSGLAIWGNSICHSSDSLYCCVFDRGGRVMTEERLKRIDPGTGLTTEELIDAFINDKREANRLKTYLSRDRLNHVETEDHQTMAVKWV